MISIADNLQVINGMTEESWLEKAGDAMERGDQIVLILQDAPAEELDELNGLASRHYYHFPNTLTEDQWTDLKPKLNLTPLGAKEQGIDRHRVYWIRPLERR